MIINNYNTFDAKEVFFVYYVPGPCTLLVKFTAKRLLIRLFVVYRFLLLLSN